MGNQWYEMPIIFNMLYHTNATCRFCCPSKIEVLDKTITFLIRIFSIAAGLVESLAVIYEHLLLYR